MSENVTGIAKICDSMCPICTLARRKSWLVPLVKMEYFTICKLMGLLRVPWPCLEREKQTGKKPWE